jgi:hypothetical protein
MSEFPLDTTVPTAMPVLSRGKHRNPSRGACFMEYTSVLAGEPFTDEPRCVDGELAAVLRGANDKLSDTDRSLLLPLLGRAIGVAVERPPARAWGLPAAARRRRREQVARYQEDTARLRRAVSRRFMAALGSSPSPATQVRCGWGEELHWLFWDLMSEPTPATRTEDHVRRLVDRLHLLHECYEQAMEELGLPRTVPTGPASTEALPADQGTPVAT